MELLTKYLLERGLFQPTDVVKLVLGQKEVPIGDEILNNDDLLERVAGMYQSNEKALEAVIRARILPNIIELLLRARPEETIVLRQVILELVEVLNDFKKYSDEHTRRKESKPIPIEDNVRKDNEPGNPVL